MDTTEVTQVHLSRSVPTKTGVRHANKLALASGDPEPGTTSVDRSLVQTNLYSPILLERAENGGRNRGANRQPGWRWLAVVHGFPFTTKATPLGFPGPRGLRCACDSDEVCHSVWCSHWALGVSYDAVWLVVWGQPQSSSLGFLLTRFVFPSHFRAVVSKDGQGYAYQQARACQEEDEEVRTLPGGQVSPLKML